MNRETLAIWLRAAAMMANRIEDNTLSHEDHLAIRRHIDQALVLANGEPRDEPFDH